MKAALLTLALPVVLLTGCASGGYYGYDGGPGPAYYNDGYYAGGPTVDVGIYGGGGYGHGGYYHHDNYRHTDTSYHSAVASRSRTSSFHSGGTRVASASHSSGHASGGHTASVSASAGHAGGDHR